MDCFHVSPRGNLVTTQSSKVYAVGYFAGKEYNQYTSYQFPHYLSSLEHLNYPKLEMAVCNAVSEILEFESPKKEIPMDVSNTNQQSLSHTLLGWLNLKKSEHKKDEKLERSHFSLI